MSVENLSTIRAYLVKLRSQYAAEAAEMIENDNRNPAGSSIATVMKLQEQIDVIDRAIADSQQ